MSSKIEWTDETWNPVTGCTKISAGCQHCYAERMAKRLAGRCGYPADEPFRVTLHPEKLEQPLKWKKPRMVFVCSMGDLFHEDVPGNYIVEVLGVIRRCPQHAFQILTKRPERMRQIMAWVAEHQVQTVFTFSAWPLPNLWLGVTAENQRRADERIPLLLQTPAAVRFVSVEPMLEPVDLRNLRARNGALIDALCGDVKSSTRLGEVYAAAPGSVDWVIAGSETGPGARPAEAEWFRVLRDQCAATGVPFFLKQVNAQRGHLLDGREYREWPEVKA